MCGIGRYGRGTRKFSAGFLIGLFALFACLLSSTPVWADAGDPVILTESGRLQGTVGSQIIEYLGIPCGAAGWNFALDAAAAFRKVEGNFRGHGIRK
jgi:hypothetical protein